MASIALMIGGAIINATTFVVERHYFRNFPKVNVQEPPFSIYFPNFTKELKTIVSLT